MPTSGNYIPPSEPLYLTPDSVPVGRFCRTISVPDSVEWISLVDGLLSTLVNPDRWRKSGALTPEETAEAWINMLVESWAIEGCAARMELRQNPTLPCLLEFSTDGGAIWTQFADIQMCAPIIRRTAGGQYQPGYKLPDGTFGYFDADEGPATTDIFDDYSPTRGMRDQTNDKCTAAANAANVIRQLYDAVGTNLVSNTTTAAAEAAASLVGEIGAAFLVEVATELAATIVGTLAVIQTVYGFTSMSDNDFHDLACIFYQNMSGTNGNWVSNTAGLTTAINAKVAASPIPWLPIRELLVFIGSAGVELAMKTTAIPNYNCTAGTVTYRWKVYARDTYMPGGNFNFVHYFDDPFPDELSFVRVRNIGQQPAGSGTFGRSIAAGVPAAPYVGTTMQNLGNPGLKPTNNDLWMYNATKYTSGTILAAIRAAIGDPAYTPTSTVPYDNVTLIGQRLGWKWIYLTASNNPTVRFQYEFYLGHTYAGC